MNKFEIAQELNRGLARTRSNIRMSAKERIAFAPTQRPHHEKQYRRRDKFNGKLGDFY